MKNAEYIIIGSGIAGAAAANFINASGKEVIVIDELGVSRATSSNPAAAMYPFFAAEADERFKYFSDAIKYSFSKISNYQNKGFYKYGIIQLGTGKKDPNNWLLKSCKLMKEYGHDCEFLNESETSEIAGIEINQKSIYYRDSGVLNMGIITKELLKDIYLVQSKVENYECIQNKVFVYADNKKYISNKLIIATGSSLNLIPDELLSKIRLTSGQLNYIKSCEYTSKLNSIICSNGYLTPSINGHNYFGSTHDQIYPKIGLKKPEIFQDDERNIQKIAESLPEFAKKLRGQNLDRWVGIRAVSKNRMPVICPHPIEKNVYISMAHGTRASISAVYGLTPFLNP